MKHLLIELCFHLNTAFHSTGNLRRLGVDKALACDCERHWVIPATTVKGFLREKAEILLRTWGHAVCTGPEPQNMCAHPNLCPVCQVFGNPRSVSVLRFTDGSPTVGIENAVRSGVAISRNRRAAYPQRLFFLETTSPTPTSWIATCEGYFSDIDAAKRAAALVSLAAHWGTTIGGSKSRGLGWIEMILVKATLDGTEIPEQDLVAFWQAWKEGANVADN